MSSNLRQRRAEAEIASTKHLDVDFDDSKKYGNNFSPVQNDRTFHKLAFSLLCIIATFVTFYKIWNPAEVV
ncbi:hypothetical protein RMATCC62417_11253 [Rhizopus microsporus]|nr:hypothetical protein RMATCC62417_11253 [Rhizopus microsporus]